MSRPTQSGNTAAIVAAALGMLTLAGAAIAARALKASDTARLHYISASGSLLYEEGGASGTIPCS